jgi:hypothetical protein
MTNFMTEACVDEKLKPIESEIAALKNSPILSATRCDGSKIEKDAKLPLCEDLAEVDNRLSKEIDVVENNITTIRTDILVIKADVVDIKTEILEIEQDIIVIKQDIAELDGRVSTIEANPVLTLVGCDSKAFPVGTKLPTCAEMTAADNALDARLDTIEAKTVLSAVGCSGAPLPANSKLPTCAEMTAADNALDARLDTIEAKTVLSAVGCSGAPLPANSKLPTCAEMTAADNALDARLDVLEAKKLAIVDEASLIKNDTTQITFVGTGVSAVSTGPTAVQVNIPLHVPIASTAVAQPDIVGMILGSGIVAQGTAVIDSAPFFTTALTAPTSGVYAIGYGFAISAEGAVGDHAVNAGTNIIFRVDGGAWAYLPGATFKHPIKTNSTSQQVFTDVNREATYVYLASGAHTIDLATRSVVQAGPTTHTFATGNSSLLVTRINATSI